VTDSAAKIKWPATIDEAEAAGYVCWQQRKKPCSCGEHIAWFRTPKGAWISISRAKDGVRILPHAMVCARIKEYRAANKAHADRVAKAKPTQQNLFE
jgi:hypothetical protein